MNYHLDFIRILCLVMQCTYLLCYTGLGRNDIYTEAHLTLYYPKICDQIINTNINFKFYFQEKPQLIEITMKDLKVTLKIYIIIDL